MGQGHDTLRADGGWTVELVTPLKHASGKEITHIDLRPVELDQVIRWGEGKIPSTLALIAEMSDVPEGLLRSLCYPDIDRVLLAYNSVVPPAIRKDFEEGARPIATPVESLPPAQVPQNVTASDRDPHWPKVPGPVKPFVGRPPHAPPAPEPEGGIAVDAPEAARKVG